MFSILTRLQVVHAQSLRPIETETTQIQQKQETLVSAVNTKLPWQHSTSLAIDEQTYICFLVQGIIWQPHDTVWQDLLGSTLVIATAKAMPEATPGAVFGSDWSSALCKSVWGFKTKHTVLPKKGGIFQNRKIKAYRKCVVVWSKRFHIETMHNKATKATIPIFLPKQTSFPCVLLLSTEFMVTALVDLMKQRLRPMRSPPWTTCVLRCFWSPQLGSETST